MKSFPIDFVRQIVEQTLLEEHIKNPTKYLGGENQVNLFSFYEQLLSNAELDRYTEKFRDLANQQNRTGLIANGVIVAPENPTITNLNQCTIIPMTFTITFRCTLEDRDLVLETLNNMIRVLKGRKIDIAELDNGKLFKVGTIGNNASGTPQVNLGDYLGDNINNIGLRVGEFTAKGFDTPTTALGNYYYTSKKGKIVVYVYDGEDYSLTVDDGTYPDVIFPPEHNSFEKYKVSISFDSIRCDEPRTLNAQEYCNISLGGSATLCNASILMGNDIMKLGIGKVKIEGNPEISFLVNEKATIYWLEPLEIPSSNNANALQKQLFSNPFLVKPHTNALNSNFQYTFVVDTSIPLIKQWYDYGRYGIQGLTASDISPNIIYLIGELYCTWGEYTERVFYAKIIESIDIENTESDILSLSVSFQNVEYVGE